MSHQTTQEIILTWGHPNATYTGGAGSKIAKIYFTPSKFEEFLEILLQKCSGDKHCITGTLQYQDEDNDWVPIESQAEYDEAVKYLCRAKNPVPLKVRTTIETRKSSHEKRSCSGTGKLYVKDIERNLRKLQKEAAKLGVDRGTRHSASPSTSAVKMHHSDKLKHKSSSSSSPPAWFEKYMQKFKSELVTEIAGMLQQQPPLAPPQQQDTTVAPVAAPPSLGSSVTHPKSLNITTEPLAYVDHKSQKLLKKLAKSHNNEKKLKKLNSKLEQLELKRARLLDWNRKRLEHGPALLLPAPATAPTLMDAAVLGSITEEGLFCERKHVAHNSFFTKKWKVLNTGTAPWTDKTELRMAWLTQGLKPLESTVSCPHLQPGEEGEISINFQAPDFAGVFESYWHFYHNDERFGQWMGCAVIVDPKPSESSDEASVSTNMTSMEVKKTESKQCGDAPESVSSKVGEIAGGEEEDRGEYESDPEEDNNASHSDVDNQSSSDSDDSEDSESFVHVPMPPCYQYQSLPVYNIQPGQEEKEKNSDVKPLTPPTTPREADSEEEELFVEASGAENHTETATTNISEPAASASTQQSENTPAKPAAPPSVPVHILPENLVSGAINVATLARNATESIMRSLHNSSIPLNIPLSNPPQSGPNTPDFYQNSTLSPQSPTEAIPMPPPVMHTPVQEAIPLPPPPVRPPSHVSSDSPYLTMLHEMGFTNHSLNVTLLAAHSNNLSEVVAELLSIQQQN